MASLLTRWLAGTHQSGDAAEHLQAYLDEFTFRFNRRHSRARGRLFLWLLEGAVSAPAPATTMREPWRLSTFGANFAALGSPLSLTAT